MHVTYVSRGVTCSLNNLYMLRLEEFGIRLVISLIIS